MLYSQQLFDVLKDAVISFVMEERLLALWGVTGTRATYRGRARPTSNGAHTHITDCNQHSKVKPQLPRESPVAIKRSSVEYGSMDAASATVWIWETELLIEKMKAAPADSRVSWVLDMLEGAAERKRLLLGCTGGQVH